MIVSNLRSERALRQTGSRELVGRSAAIARVQELIRRAAHLDGGVLLVAEPGIDVESVARELHDLARAAHDEERPYVHVECATSDSARLDRVLFGTARGGSPSEVECVSNDSAIARARGGTLVLQDVTDLPASLQARLARIVRDAEVSIDDAAHPTNVRLIASASPGIDGEVHASRFRTDLYRRLAVSRLDLPPLRDRPEDIPALALRLLADWCVARRVGPRSFTQPACSLIAALTWPGNLAELQTVVQRVAEDSLHDVIQIEDLLPALNLDRSPVRFAPSGHLREVRSRFEREYITAVLQHHGWRMADAAETLGIQRPNLYRKARQLGIPLTRATGYSSTDPERDTLV